MKIIIIVDINIDHKTTPGNSNIDNNKFSKNITIALLINFVCLVFMCSIIFIIAKSMKSIISNNNKIIETNFQLYFADIYMVVGPSAPPIIATADASFIEERTFGDKLIEINTPIIIEMPKSIKNMRKIILFLLSILFFLALINYFNMFPKMSMAIAYNVPAVTDGFLFAIRKLRSSFSQTKNCGGTKTHKGRSPTVFLCSPSHR